MGVVTIAVVLLTVVLKLTGCGIPCPHNHRQFRYHSCGQASDWKGKEVEGTENSDVIVVVEICRVFSFFLSFLKAFSLFVSYYVISKRIHEMSRQK